MKPSSQRWFFQETQPQAKIQLFCFPYAGGSISSYLPWQKALGVEIQVICVQLPGRGSRLFEPCIDSFQELIETLTDLVASQVNQPYLFFGHSLGGLVAFEVTRGLRKRQTILPKQLIISACEAPHNRSESKRLHELNDDALTQALAELSGTPTDILENKELMRLLLPGIRSDFRLNAEYLYSFEPPLKLPLTILAGQEDTHVDIHKLRKWQEQTTAEYQIHVVPGNHFFIDNQRNIVVNLLKNIVLEV
jgi:medium-chain acyl-[acyl-carrier-protein] hydrolase